MQLKCETFRMQSLSNVDVPKFALPNDMSFRVLSRSDLPRRPVCFQPAGATSGVSPRLFKARWDAGGPLQQAVIFWPTFCFPHPFAIIIPVSCNTSHCS